MATAKIERELKYQLEAHEAERVRLLMLGWGSDYTLAIQVNSYWDTPNFRFLKERGDTIRVRESTSFLPPFDKTAEVTIKHKEADGPAGENVSKEWTLPIEPGHLLITNATCSTPCFLDFPEAVKDFLKADSIRVWGRLPNLRLESTDGVTGTTCLDRTFFPDGEIEYELEVESDNPDKAKDLWAIRLAQLEIPVRPQSIGKSKRLRMKLCLAIL